MFEESKVYFKIDSKELILDKVLVEFNGEPIFFVCKTNNEFYIALNIDTEYQYYIVTPMSAGNLYKMLDAKITMRELILQAEYFWNIEVGDDFDSDIAIKKLIDQIPMEQLPYEGEFLNVVTQDLKNYREDIKNIILGTDDWEDSSIVSQGINCEELVNCCSEQFARLIRYLTHYDKAIEISLDTIVKDVEKIQYEKEVYDSVVNLHNKCIDGKILISNDNKLVYAA